MRILAVRTFQAASASVSRGSLKSWRQYRDDTTSIVACLALEGQPYSSRRAATERGLSDLVDDILARARN